MRGEGAERVWNEPEAEDSVEVSDHDQHEQVVNGPIHPNQSDTTTDQRSCLRGHREAGMRGGGRTS